MSPEKTDLISFAPAGANSARLFNKLKGPPPNGGGPFYVKMKNFGKQLTNGISASKLVGAWVR
jgi:hypothetical protein